MERSNRTSLHENRQIKMLNSLQPPTGPALAEKRSLPNRSAGDDRLVGPRDTHLRHLAFRQAGKSRPCDVVVFHNRTTDSHLGPIAEESLWYDRQAVREEWVLCKSILSPQREPTGESIIRRNKSPMLPESGCFCLEILPAGRKKSQNLFPWACTFLLVLSCRLSRPTPCVEHGMPMHVRCRLNTIGATRGAFSAPTKPCRWSSV